MTDFLASLAARALGLTPAIRPVPEPVFPPPPPVAGEGWLDVAPAAGAVEGRDPEPRTGEWPAMPAASPPASRRSGEDVFDPGPHGGTTRVVGRRSSLALRVEPTDRAASPFPVPGQDGASAFDSDPGGVPEVADGAETGEVTPWDPPEAGRSDGRPLPGAGRRGRDGADPAAATTPAPPQRRIPAPRVRPVEGRPGTRPADPARSPASVHVTIGRVEVRAVTPVPGASVPRPPDRSGKARGPALSLDEYLRRGSGGGR